MFIHFVSKPLLFLASLLSDQNCKQVHIHRLLSVYRKRGIFQHSTLPYCEFTQRSGKSVKSIINLDNLVNLDNLDHFGWKPQKLPASM